MTDQPLTDAELRDQLKAAIAALGKSETELAQLRRRNRLAHKARRAKEHQLDGIRRALCDIGVMQDDDPYSHADLEDVIRQAGRLDELAAAVAADLDSYGEEERADPAPATAGLRQQIAAALYERERPPRDPSWADAYAADREVFEAMAGAVLAVLPKPADRAAILADAADCAYRIARRLDDQHHDQRAQGAWDVENVLRAEVRRLAAEASAASDPIAEENARRHKAAIARVDELLADAERVRALYERWVKAGPPPLGASLARWWDQRLVELRTAVLGTKDPS